MRLLNKLAAPETWFHLCTFLAFIGDVLMAIGYFFNYDVLIKIGWGLNYPLLICAGIISFVFLPVILISNARKRRSLKKHNL